MARGRKDASKEAARLLEAIAGETVRVTKPKAKPKRVVRRKPAAKPRSKFAGAKAKGKIPAYTKPSSEPKRAAPKKTSKRSSSFAGRKAKGKVPAKVKASGSAKVGTKRTVKPFKSVADTIDYLYPKGKGEGKGRAATSKVAPSFGVPMAAGGTSITRVGRNLGIATAKDPGKVIVSTGKSVPQVAAGAVSFAGSLATDPVGTVKKIPREVWDDYKRRYGASDEEMRRRFKEEGVLPELVDAATAGTMGGAAVGRILRPLAKKAPEGSALRKATEPRPKLRETAGGPAREQERSKNVLRALAEDKKDASRKKKFEKRKRAAEERDEPIQGLVPGEGEVVRRSPRAQKRTQRQAVADRQSRAFVKLRREQEREIDGKTGARKNLRKLDSREKKAFAYVLGLGLPADPKKAAVVLREKRAQIVRARADNPNAKVLDSDELKTIDEILKAPEKYITPRLRAVADVERARGERTAKLDPSFKDETARARRVQEQAILTGKKRGGVPIEVAVKQAQAEVKRAKRERRKSGNKLTREEYKAGRTVGRAEVRSGQADKRTGVAIAKAERSERIARKSAANYRAQAARVKTAVRSDLSIKKRGVDPKTLRRSKEHAYWVVDENGRAVSTHPNLAGAANALKVRKGDESVPSRGVEERRAALISKAEAADRRALAAKARVAELKREVGRKPVASLGVAEKQGARTLAASQARLRADEAVRVAKANAKDLERKKRKGISRINEEPLEHYVKRVEKAAKKKGLEPGGYVMARKRPTGVASSFTVGTGGRAVAGAGKSKGDLAATGRRDLDPEATVTGVARNIKRGVNWNLVGDVWEANTPEWGRNMRAEQLRDVLAEKKLDPADWRLIDTAKFREARKRDSDVDADAEIDGTPAIADALSKATFTLDGALGEFKGTGQRLSLVPRVIADELEAGTRPAGTALRTFQKIQGQTSRILLNTNPTFVPVQIVSQTPLAIFGMKGRVWRLVSGQTWYRGLPAESKAAVDDFIGISAARSSNMTPRYGVAPDSRLAKGFAALVDNPRVKAWQGSRANPMTWNPYFDDKQNAFFRRAMFYDAARRQARDNIGRNARGIRSDARPLIKLLEMPDGPEKLAALKAAEPQFVRVAEKVDDMLGNYTRYTAAERKGLKSAVLFYGFMRWSTRFAFYTLPVKHPVAASISAKLGQMQREEIISLLADEAASMSAAPAEEYEKLLRAGWSPWAFGRIWLTKNGTLESIDLARVNPMLTPLVDALSEGPKAFVGLTSPVFTGLADLAYDKSGFLGTELRDAEGKELDAEGRFKYWAGQLGSIAFPLRAPDRVLNPEPQASDAIPLLSPSPKRAKTEKTREKHRQIARDKGSTGERVLDQAIPFRAKPGGTVRGLVKTLEEKQGSSGKKSGKKTVRKRKKKDAGFSFGGSSSGGSSSGGSGFSFGGG